MLDIKKMIKQSFKETYKKMLLMNGVLLFSFVLLGVTISLSNSVFIVSPIGAFIISSFMIFTFIMMISSLIFILQTMFKLLYQKLFTNEGYLTFTLPVSVDSLIISRLIVNIVWCIFNALVSIIGIFIVFFIVSVKDFEDIFTIFKAFDLTGLDFIEFISIIFYFIVSIIFIACALLMILSALAFSNSGTLKKGKTALAVLLYIIIFNFYSVLISMFSTFFSFGIAFDYNTNKYIFAFGSVFKYNYLINFIPLLLGIASLIGLYYLCRYLLKKKIELT